MIIESTIPLAPAATTDIVRDRAWWAEESIRVGTDWPRVVATALGMLTMAAREAWRAPSWREAAVKYHEARPDSSPRVAPPRNRRAPEATVEALAFALRRGVNELVKPDTQRRLSALDETQLESVCVRVQALKPAIAEAWCAEDADLLISAWRKLREQR
jgi:hypothetical protein